MNTQYKSVLTLAVVTAVLFSCKQNPEKKTDKETAQTETHHGIQLKYMDTTVSPKDDFYNYVNGAWMKEATIPSDRKSWGSFNKLRKNTDSTVLALLNDAIKNNTAKSGSDQAKAVYLYKSELDTAARTKAGINPVQPALKKIAKITDLKSLQAVLESNPVEIGNPFFGIYATAKLKQSSMNGAYLSPGSLGLPDRAYYIKDDAKSKEVRQQYVDHITRMFTLIGEDKAEAQDKAKRILALETKLATPRLKKEERRDARNLANPRSIAQISEMLPAVDWNALIAAFPVKKTVDTMIVTQLKYTKALQDILTNTDINDIKALVSWATLNSAASQLTPELEKANWDFYSHTLNGTPQQRPADERALSTVNGVIGEAVGKIYVDKKFPPKAKEMAETMVQNIIATYEDRINNLDWMGDSTKVKAIAKLKALTIKIGYPNKWKDYSKMAITADNSYYQNMAAAAKWHLKENLSKIGEPVDPTEWHMNPQTVNAYYNPSMNEIVFPAAILQPPFFDYKADAAVNFGGIGAVIGHEISHAFDDSGSRFDAEGNLNNWWTKDDLTKFTKRTQKLADFYSKVTVGDSVHLNGEYTLGENTADLGGVLAAYYGLQRYYKTHEKPGKIDGFTQNQRFFLSWATVWRTKTRPAALLTQIKTDPHSPGIYRAYLPLQNVDAFYKAFDIKKGDSMYVTPEDRVRIW